MSTSPRPNDPAGGAVIPPGPTLAGTGQWEERLRDGTPVTIRLLRPEDRSLETDFLRGLSPRTRRARFLCDFRQPSDTLVDQLMDVDDDRRLAFIALADLGGELREIGVSRYCAAGGGYGCECAVTVADDWQRRGLGVLLMRHLIGAAREHGFRRMVSVDAASNQAMQSLATRLGFRRRLDPAEPSQAIHTLELEAPCP